MGMFRKGQTWYIDYYVNGNRKREAVGSNRKMAERALAKRQVQVVEERFLDIVRTPKVSFEDLVSAYVEYAKTNKTSWARDVQSIMRLRTAFGKCQLVQIVPLSIEKYKAERLKIVSPATVNRELACLKHMFTKAIQWNMAKANPVKQVRLMRESNQRLRYLTNSEINRLLSELAPHIRPIVVCALQTGMRRNEILNLQWVDVDTEHQLLFVRNTKNGEKRELPISSVLAEVFKSMPKVTEYVFTRSGGGRIFSVREGFTSAVGRAGIINFTFHDLRHTVASHLVMSGVDLLTVKELLGHKSIAMTLRYAHLSPDHKRKAVELLGYRDGHYLDTDAPRQKVA